MVITFGVISILSLAAGWAFGYFNQMSVFNTLVCIGVAGFIGSSIIALIFSFLYFREIKKDRDNIVRSHRQINQRKEIKRIE